MDIFSRNRQALGGSTLLRIHGSISGLRLLLICRCRTATIRMPSTPPWWRSCLRTL